MQVGVNRTLIKTRQRGIGMMGYGKPENVVSEAHSDLYVRSCVLQDATGQWLIFANAEICFVTQAIQQEVCRRLQHLWPDLEEASLVLSAQHTHSAPGGYSHYPFYNVPVPGFQPAVFEAIVKAFVSSIQAARSLLQPAQAAVATLPFADRDDVAFNRSLAAYNRNPENTPLSPEQTHLALDRNMYLLKLETPSGQPLAVLNWFGVHATNLSSHNQGISSDNKGYAALSLENHFRRQGHDVLCIFAQAAAGDVSPNFYGQGKNWPRGKFSNEHESLRFNGQLQARQALRILEQAEFTPLEPVLDSRLIYADLTNVACDPVFTQGQTGCRTVPAAHGVAFLQGTTIDGPGISPALAAVISRFCTYQRQRLLQKLQTQDPPSWELEHITDTMQAPKVIAIESGAKRFLGLANPTALPVPDALEPVIAEFKRLWRLGTMREHSWTPQILPLQIVRIGQWSLLAFPGETTTTAARRLCQSVQAVLKPLGVQQTVICCYANTYFGYTTTPEEYELQCYEGGHTVFGRWTLPAFQTLYAEVAQALLEPPAQRPAPPALRPPVFSDEELALRTGGHWL